MIPLFEDYTCKIGEKTQEFLQPIMVNLISLALGKDNAISSRQIQEYIFDKYPGKYVSRGTISKLASYLRKKMIIKNLCACQHGYFIAVNKFEIEQYALSNELIGEQFIKTSKLMKLQATEHFKQKIKKSN